MHTAIMEDTLSYLKALLDIPSPSGYTHMAAAYVRDELSKLSFSPVMTRKGAVLADIGGEGAPLLLAAHIDTLGGMVRSVKANGRLRPTTIGGFTWPTADGENCTVFTRSGEALCGVALATQPSAHVFGADVERDEAHIEILLDADPQTAAEARALGAETGDFIAFDPRTIISPTGIIKSRFLDDKASAAVLLALAKLAAEKKLAFKRKVYILFTVHEEVGHGGSSGIPDDVCEMISVDMGCVGDDLSCTEHMVSICAKDSGGPYHYQTTTALVNTAKRHNIAYAVDIYPRYGSDVETTLRAGYDIRHGLVGPGVYASHNYERTHVDGLKNTLLLLWGYVETPAADDL